MRMPELAQPGVALTDFILSAECAVLALLLIGKSATRISYGKWFVAMYFSLAATSLLGGILHGFFDLPEQRHHHLFWRLTLLSLGTVAFTVYNLAGALLKSKTSSRITFLSAIGLVFYSIYVVTGYRSFLTGIAFYLPASVFLLTAILLRARKFPQGRIQGIAGITLTFMAAAIQQSHFYVEPFLLNYDTLYHVVQGVALWLLYRYAVETVNTNH